MGMRRFAGYFASIKVEYECSLSSQHFQYDCSHPKSAQVQPQWHRKLRQLPNLSLRRGIWCIQTKLELANAAFAHAAHGQQYSPRHIQVTLTCFITASPIMLAFGKNYLLTLSS